MNWYRIANNEEEFKVPSEVEGVYHLNDTTNPDEIGMLGLRGKAEDKFFEATSGTKNWLIRWIDNDGKIRTNNVLSIDRKDALIIFERNIGKSPIDIIAVNVGIERIPNAKNHRNIPLNAYELKQLAYIGITPEQIEKSKSTTKRPWANWKAYIEKHFGER